MLPGLQDPHAIVARAVADAWAPRPMPTVDVWCERHRRLVADGAGSARSGLWDTSRTPYWRQVMRQLTDPRVKEITCKKSSQVGFSEVLINFVLYTGAQRLPCLVGYPTYDEAKDFNKKRLIPALEACDVVAGMIDRARDVTEAEIRLGSTPIWFAWAHSTKTFKSDPVARIVLDEIDEYPAGGQILSNARDRQRTFTDRKLLKGSTPEDDEAEGYITQEYESSRHRYRFMVPCPITGDFFELYDFSKLIMWKGGRDADPDAAARGCWLQSPCVPLPRHKVGTTSEGVVHEHYKPWMVAHGVGVRQGEEIESDGRILETLERPGPRLSEVDGDLLREAPESGRMSRLSRRREHTETERAAMGLGVRIVGGDDGVGGLRPAASTVAYRINALASLIDAEGWGGIVRKGLKENFGADWQKGTLGQAPRIKGDIASVRHLEARCVSVADGGYRVGELPGGTAVACVGVDVQKYGVYIDTYGFGDRRTHPALVDAVYCTRDERYELEDVYDVLAGLRFRIGAGEVRPYFIGIDSGFWTGHVYDLCRKLRAAGLHAVATKGFGGRNTGRLVETKDVERKDESGRPTGERDPVLHFHADQMKNRVFGLIAPSGKDGGHAAGEGENPGDLGETLGEPLSLRLPEPWQSDDGRISRDTGRYLRQMTAERRKWKRTPTGARQVWEPKREGMDNHDFDCATIAFAGAYSRGVEQFTADQIEEHRERVMRDGVPVKAGDGPSSPPQGGDSDRRARRRSVPSGAPTAPDRPRHARPVTPTIMSRMLRK